MPLPAIGAVLGAVGGAAAAPGAFTLASLGSATALAGAGLGMAVGSSIDQANAAKKAQSMAQNLQYKPIDLDALQKQAQGYAQENIAKSIELEKQYMPELSAARFGLQKQVAADLERGGRLPLDVANQVTRATMAQAGAGGFGAGPLTAANLGMTAYDLRQRALDRAAMLTESTPLPVSGLSPGDLASAAIGQSQAQNQFELSKTGALANALQSRAAATSGLAGAFLSAAQLYANQTPRTGSSTFTSGKISVPQITSANTMMPTTTPTVISSPAGGFTGAGLPYPQVSVPGMIPRFR